MNTLDDFNPRLLGDIGGTNARFAWQSAPGAPIERGLILPGADYATLSEAIVEYLRRIEQPVPKAASIAMANPVLGDHVRMTNHNWSFSIAEMQRSFGFAPFVVLNDFKAIALSLPSLSPVDLHRVGGGEERADGPRAVIGPGTGLGVAGLVADGRGNWIAIDGEGGHSTLAAVTEREWRVVDWLARRHGHASAERAISGQGLADIHRALLEIDGHALADVEAAAITEAALDRGDPVALEALELFCAFLGTVAGNLALTLGATGGVYIGGGIVPRLGRFFDASPFRRRFESKGRFSSYAAGIPTWVIVRETSPALLGAERALDSAVAALAT